MKNLSNFIKGLQLIEAKEGGRIDFEMEYYSLCIGKLSLYSKTEKDVFYDLGFYDDAKNNSWAYDLNETEKDVFYDLGFYDDAKNNRCAYDLD